MTGRAYADSSVTPKGNFTYVFLSATTQGCSLSNLAITSSDASFNNPFPLGVGPISYQTHSGSTYKFSNIGENVQINVDKASPATGTYISGSIKKTIPLGGVSAFNVCFGKGADNLSGKITTSLKVNFGETDSTKTIQDAQVTIACVGASSSPNCLPTLIGAGQSVKPSIASLTDKTVSFKYPFTGLILGQKYKVCYSADYVIGSSGKDGDPVCKEVTATKAGATVAMTAQGDASKLESPPQTGSSTCEASGFSLSWIVCPVINGLASAIDGIYGHIVAPYLKINTFTASDKNTGVYRAWSDLRILGNVFLVIALLVIVFGEALGGGLIDAYTAKKALPKILVAAILINLSYYICGFLVDIFNVVGEGIFNLLVHPFTSVDGFGIHFNGYTEGETATLGLAGLVATGWGAAAGATAVGGVAMAALGWLWAFVLLPALLILVAIVLTVFLRRALIIVLTIFSPVAFALYCLPNTEKYFKKWWDAFVETLVVFPIIAVLFAAGNIAALVIPTTTGGALEGFAAIIAVMALIIPLALIPFAFKLAGGIIGKVHETLADYGKRGHQGMLGNPNDPNSWRNRTRGKMRGSVTRANAEVFRRVNRSGRIPRTNAILFGGAIEKEAMENQESKKRIFAIKDNGDDRIVNARASFVDPVDKRRKTLDGKPVSEAEWKAAKRLYPNLSDVQTVADYRSTKVNSSEEAVQFARNFGLMAKQRGLSLDETKGAFTALAFARQNERGEWKHGSWSEDANGDYVFSPVGASNMGGAEGYVHEQYYKKGSFDASRAFSSQFQSMGEVKREHLNRIARGMAAGATPEQQQEARESREQLKKILEIQGAWEHNAGMRDPETGEVIQGLSGASAGTKAAFDKMKAVGTESDADRAVVASVQAEINSGQTWEATHSAGGAPPPSPGPQRPQPPTSPSGGGPTGGPGPSTGGGGPTIIIPPSGYTGSQG